MASIRSTRPARSSSHSKSPMNSRRRPRPISRSSKPTKRVAISGPSTRVEPLYGEAYLPRKFKIGIAHPTDNSIDVLTQDVGLVPVAENGVIDGSVWDLYSGGGLGLTHNMPQTAPLLGLYLGRVRREQIVEAVQIDRDPAARERRAEESPPGALEVHDPSTRLGRGQNAARSLWDRTRRFRADGAAADGSSPRLARATRWRGAITVSRSRTAA